MPYSSREKRIKVRVLCGFVLYISILMACASSKFGVWIQMSLGVDIDLPSAPAYIIRLAESLFFLAPR